MNVYVEMHCFSSMFSHLSHFKVSEEASYLHPLEAFFSPLNKMANIIFLFSLENLFFFQK